MSARKKSRAWLWASSITLVAISLVMFIIFVMLRPSVMAVQLGDGAFKAAIARTDAEHKKGLSGVEYLSQDQAMLFVFSSEGVYDIWMKDMKIPIDAVWLDSNKRVIHVEKNLQPDSYPKTYRSTAPARYIVELPAGAVEARSITINDTAGFDERKAGV